MRNINRADILKIRHTAKRIIRSYFELEGFLEVDTPVLVESPNPSAHFDYINCGVDGFLNTSPEFHMKRLQVEGFEKIYQICPCFRKSEHGNKHNPEFYMIEWYRSLEILSTVMDDFENIIKKIIAEIKLDTYFSTFDLSCFKICVEKKWDIYSFFDILTENSGIDVRPDSNKSTILKACKSMDIEIKDEYSLIDIYSLLWDKIESNLGLDNPVWIVDWPEVLADISKIRKTEIGNVAERAELYYNGIELCNGFNELQDPDEHLNRFKSEINIRIKDSKTIPTIDDKFINSLRAGYPKSAGMAAGLERLLMALLGIENISKVMAFDYRTR